MVIHPVQITGLNFYNSEWKNLLYISSPLKLVVRILCIQQKVRNKTLVLEHCERYFVFLHFLHKHLCKLNNKQQLITRAFTPPKEDVAFQHMCKILTQLQRHENTHFSFNGPVGNQWKLSKQIPVALACVPVLGVHITPMYT